MSAGTTDPGLTLPAREGVAVPLRAGERLRIVNRHGGQVVDTWALARTDLREYLSMEHTRTSLGKLGGWCRSALWEA